MKARFYNFLCKISKGPKASLLIYWKGYGHKEALFKSLYFWLSSILAIFIYIFQKVNGHAWEWQNDVISIVPTVFGFSVGGFAILIGFGNDKFRKEMCYKKDENDISIYLRVNAAFFHFVFVQFICLLYTILAKAFNITNVFPFNLFGVFIFIYAIFTIIAVAFAILRLARMFDRVYPPENNK